MDCICVRLILAFGQGHCPGLDVQCIVWAGDHVRRWIGLLTLFSLGGGSGPENSCLSVGVLWIKMAPMASTPLNTWFPVGGMFGKELEVWPHWRCVTRF